MSVSVSSLGLRTPPSRFRAVVAEGLHVLWVWRTRQRDRAELRSLLERADDRMLGDVGLTRAQLADIGGKPFWQP